MTTAETIIFVAFSVANACRLLAYLPQISVILKERDTAAVSSATWLLFFLSNAITAIYAARVVADTTMALTFMANTTLLRCDRHARALQAQEISSGHLAFRIFGRRHLAVGIAGKPTTR